MKILRNHRRAVQAIVFLWMALVAAHGDQLVPENPAAFFLAPGQSTSLVWDVQDKGPAPTKKTYTITDYAGKVVSQGDAPALSGKVSVAVDLQRGYYDIEVWGQQFGIVAQEAHTGEFDDFFGMDAVLNWLDRRPAMREVMVEDMKRSGIPMARERINWNLVEPSPGTWNWEETDQAWALRQIYEKHGMKVLEMFHSPGAARGPFPVETHYPQNLVVLSKSWPVIYDKFKATWGGLEVWNEPDGGFGAHLPADQYVTLVKAMRYALQTHGVTAPMGGGVFIGGDPGVFHQFCVLNGMLDDVDFVSFHDYKPATKMERLVGVYRAWLKAGGKEGMPLWISECGWPWPKAGGRPLLDEDRKSALEITMKGVEARACGIVRFNPFCLPFYEERNVDSFSLLGKDVTPLRAMGAYVQSIRVLSGKTYVGDLPVKDKSILRDRVFEDETGKGPNSTGRLIIVYTDEVKDGASVSLPVKASRIEGIDGRELTPNADGAIPIPDGMVYVWTDGGTINRETTAMALLQASRTKTGPATIAGPIVLQYVLDPAQGTYSSTHYVVSQEMAKALHIKVRVHNLSSKEEKMTLRLALPGDTVQQAQAREQNMDVEAESVTEVNWTVDASGKWHSLDTLPILITGATSDGKTLSPLAIPMLVEGQLDDYLKLCPHTDRLDVGDLGQWSKNIAKTGTMQMDRETDGAWKLTVTFPSGDPWVFPKLQIKPGLLTGASGFLVRARVMSAATVRLLVFDRTGADYMTSYPIIPPDGKWHVAYVPLDSLEPSQNVGDKGNGDLVPADVRYVSVGLNNPTDNRKNVLEVSDLIVVGK